LIRIYSISWGDDYPTYDLNAMEIDKVNRCMLTATEQCMAWTVLNQLGYIFLLV
jgi:hypothetical protein